MQLFLFQSLIAIAALVAVLNVLRRFREGTFGIRGTIFWCFFWIAVCILIFWPQGVQMVARTFGIGRGSDFIFYVSIVILFNVVFRLHIKIEQMARQITKMVRKDALENASERKKSNS